MPLYDYECQQCGSVKEVQHSVNEIGKIEILCEDCKKPMKKMISLPALIGFDDVGRSKSRKDKEDAPKNDTSKKDTPKKDASSKDTAKKVEAKKDAAA